MLKIKDNIDLKELEKFNFCKCDDDIKVDDVPILYDCYCYKNFYLYITKDRRIYGEQCDYVRGVVLSNENFDTLYDLIRADMIEKVEK